MTWQGAAWLRCKTVPGRVRGVVTYKQVVLLEFKGLPTLVLLVNPLVKGGGEEGGEKKRRRKKKKQDLIKPSIPGCLGKRWGEWVALGLEQA